MQTMPHSLALNTETLDSHEAQLMYVQQTTQNKQIACFIRPLLNSFDVITIQPGSTIQNEHKTLACPIRQPAVSRVCPARPEPRPERACPLDLWSAGVHGHPGASASCHEILRTYTTGWSQGYLSSCKVAQGMGGSMVLMLCDLNEVRWITAKQARVSSRGETRGG